MTLGENFHTIDVFQAPDPTNAQKPVAGQVGLFHIAFEVAEYAGLKDAYSALIEHGVEISHCTDHVSQRSIYFADPDGNRLEIYFEVPDALRRYAVEGRGDQDVPLQVTHPGEPLPAWLDEDWLARFEPVAEPATAR
jgi:catechol-2,3-dioxygenase